MSKTYKIIDSTNFHTTQSVLSVDWEKCVLCQKITDEALQCPADSRRADIEIGIGYQTLASNLKQFHELGCLPVRIDITSIDDGDGIAETLNKHKAKWHRNCKNKFNTLKLQRAKKRGTEDETQISSHSESKVTRQSFSAAANPIKNICFFCGETSENLHKASTFNLDQKVRRCALELQDTILLAKLSAGDLISQDAFYHAKCLISLYNKARKISPTEDTDNTDRRLEGIALAELVGYIEDVSSDSDMAPVFKLAELAKMYASRLQQLGLDTDSRVHTTDLKNRILSNFPDMQAYKQGRQVLLAFNENVGPAIKKACECDFDDEALILAKAAKIVRRDIFDIKSEFNGTFGTKCQQESVPQSVKTLVGMILGGPNIQSQSGHLFEGQASLTISQLLQFNCSRRQCDGTGTYHRTVREPPLPIYLGFLIHAETRKRCLVEKLYDLGMSISYDRVLALSTAMGNSVSAQFEVDQVVCPPKLRSGIFTTAAVDNIDHNPSSTTATGALHGTGISLFQHPSPDFPGEARDPPVIDNEVTIKKSRARIPEAYAIVPPAALHKKDPVVPATQGPLISDGRLLPSAFEVEHRWLEHVRSHLQTDVLEDLQLSWAAFHASQNQTDLDIPLDLSALLPLFQEEAKSVAMILHSMNMVGQAVNFLNPGQTPVLACDQPLYALAKRIQWSWPESHGEENLVVMFGGLHIEMTALKTIGSWLEDSGWTSALVDANIASPGTADSFLKATHVSRTRNAHQVTICALHILMAKAYVDYVDSVDQHTSELAFDDWSKVREAESPQFQYWAITLRFELAILIFVRSQREGNFDLYKDALTLLIPWFFSLDHPNYARWLPVHMRDMLTLDRNHPSVAAEFREGKFVVHKTAHAFSAIPIDHAHEQNNKCVKGDGGAVGLTENTAQLLRWMICGPEIARAIDQFQTSQELLKQVQNKAPDIRHHEQVQGCQVKFKEQVNSLVNTMEKMGNPFMESSGDLLRLDTHDIIDQSVTKTIREVEMLGREQYETFVAERLEKRTRPLSDPIRKNKLPLFSCPPSRTVSKEKQQIASLKQNCSLFSQLYISCQVRDGDLEDFFCHENQNCPPSLSQCGQLRAGCKSDLLICLEKMAPAQIEVPDVDAILLDGAAIVNMLKPGASRTFQEYSQEVFLPYLHALFQKVERLDVVWDEYITDSLKSATRRKRGKGVRRRCTPDTRMPGNWQAFLRIDENKEELFHFLAEQTMLIECEEAKQVLTTKGREVLSNISREGTDELAPCSHEEADTRLLLHAADAGKEGCKRVMLRTVDTDVGVLAISVFENMLLEELWIAFGVGKNLRYLAVHDLAKSMGPKAKALPGFHAFTGCDQTSAFAGRGKKTAWETWKVYEEVTPAFEILGKIPTEDAMKSVMPLLERFVVLMYDRASACLRVNEARKDLFSHKGRSIDSIPPTADALLQHTKRSSYQAGHVWGQSLRPDPQLPCPKNWGWVKDSLGRWEPFWTSLPQASESCQELLKCGCKTECRGRCKCVKAEMLCTALCKCGGDCERV